MFPWSILVCGPIGLLDQAIIIYRRITINDSYSPTHTLIHYPSSLPRSWPISLSTTEKKAAAAAASASAMATTAAGRAPQLCLLCYLPPPGARAYPRHRRRIVLYLGYAAFESRLCRFESEFFCFDGTAARPRWFSAVRLERWIQTSKFCGFRCVKFVYAYPNCGDWCTTVLIQCTTNLAYEKGIGGDCVCFLALYMYDE